MRSLVTETSENQAYPAVIIYSFYVQWLVKKLHLKQYTINPRTRVLDFKILAMYK